ncbi:MAG: hypothetical protein H7A23_03430 [Leptospiraceae bacterium]|nr:hypothetical protein [Leptospiraceae bacterium]
MKQKTDSLKNTSTKNIGVYLCISVVCTLFAQCKYTGGYDIVKGSKALNEIKKKMLSYSSVGTAVLFSTPSSSYTCPSTTSATVVTDTEPNDTYKYAQKFDFPSDSKSTRIQGTISKKDSDYDIFYMVVPSNTTYTKFYFKGISGNAACWVLNNSDGSELNNDTQTANFDVTTYIDKVYSSVSSSGINHSDYIFFYCFSSTTDGATYDIELSLTEIGSSSSTNTSSLLNSFSSLDSLLSNQFGPQVLQMSAGIKKDKYYTKSSLDECLKELKTTIPVESLINTYNLLNYLNCGIAYKPMNPYFVAGWKCNLQEAGWIQIGDLGL